MPGDTGTTTREGREINEGQMADEEEKQELTISDDDVRKSKLFQKQAALASDLKRRLEELETAENARKEEIERKQAEEQGNWKTLLAAKEKDLAEKTAAYQRDLLSKDVQLALVREGATNEIFLRGAIASFKGNVEDIADFVSSLKGNAENAVFFGQESKAPAPGKVTPAAKSMKTLEERVAEGDVDAQREMFNRLLGIS